MAKYTVTANTRCTAIIGMNFFQASSFNIISYKYFTSRHCTGKYELDKLTSLLKCGSIAQLVEHHTGIAEVTSLSTIEALIFFQASFQLLKLENLLRSSLFTYINNSNDKFKKSQ